MTSLAPQDSQGRSPGLAHRGPPWEKAFPVFRRCMGQRNWERLRATLPATVSLDRLLKGLGRMTGPSDTNIPDFLPDLARLEWAFFESHAKNEKSSNNIEQLTINPTLVMLDVQWANLPLLFDENGTAAKDIRREEEMVLIWQHPDTKKTEIQSATAEDLLVLKMVVEDIDTKAVAASGNLPIGAVDAALDRGVSKGIFYAPGSLIERKATVFPEVEEALTPFLSASVFTLQWHITQACDLHCKHCYDRSDRSPLSEEQAIDILDDMRRFCRERHVRGQISFTGGNPLLYPHFTKLYQAATDRGFTVAILGNPTNRKTMESLLAIQQPVFFQVSLEGMESHNDWIRGKGHFKRVMAFLELLKDLGISSKVMLTLTKGNLDHVLPLAETLRDRVDDFTFNRLSMVGEGANLQPPEIKDFAPFLESYVEASRRNPVMGWKDNFINLVCRRKGDAPFGGCTGYGCGAAFNFVSVLSDGQVHACRKFPSLIGNIYTQNLGEIYDSKEAEQYRAGPRSCRSCRLRLVCRGCLAVSYSHGLNVLEDRDPYCFLEKNAG